jgi:hypothetical protein
VLCAALLVAAPCLDIAAQATADSVAALLYISSWTSALHAGGVPITIVSVRGDVLAGPVKLAVIP